MMLTFSSSSSRGDIAFTVPRVPTGMKTGVRMDPWAVSRTPSRAWDTSERRSTVKQLRLMGG